jgi:hypothetical protein
LTGTTVRAEQVSEPKFYYSRDHQAMTMAIAYFNWQHEKNITVSSPEFRFMKDLLTAINAKDPVLGDAMTELTLKNVRFDSKRTVYATLYSAAPIVKKTIAKWLAQVATECGSTSEASEKEMLTSVDLSSPTCSRAIEGLVKNGFRTLELENENGEARRLMFTTGEGDLRDMKYMKNVISQEPAFADLGLDFYIPGECKSCVTIGDDGGGLAIATLGKDHSTTEHFKFTFGIGWGDCMAGCAHKHKWTVEATPIQNGDQFNFELSVSESGPPVPANWRKIF